MLVAAGSTLIEVSNIMSLPVKRIKELLKFESKTDHRVLRDIKNARKKWLEKLDHDPNRLVIQVRKNNWGLYRFLIKYDHEWIIKQGRSRQQKVDWTKRDTEWSQALKNAASRIADKYPGRRIAKSAMIKEAGLNLRIVSEMHRLPKCDYMLNNFSESRIRYRERQEDLKLFQP